MKLRRFLLALALVVCSTAAAMAQGGGGGGRMPVPPVSSNPEYDRGYSVGWNAGINSILNRNEGGYAGYITQYRPVKKQLTFKDGYDDGYNAARGFDGTGAFGNGFNVSFNGYDLGNPLVRMANAPIIYEHFYQESLQAKERRAQSYLAARERYSSYRAQIEALHPHATPEELAALRNARLPAPLSKDEFDPARGVIRWPGVLKRAEFDESRAKLEVLFRETDDNPHSSGLGTQNYHDTEHAINDMSDRLHSEIAEFEPDEYIAASKFLKRLLHHASMPPANPPPK